MSDGAERQAYSGTHETTKFGERDSGNVLLVEIAGRGSAPKLTPIRTGGLTWKMIENEILEPEDLARTREGIESLSAAEKTLLDVRLRGVLHPNEQNELTRIDEIVQARFLYGRIDYSQLLPAPEDESWLSGLPVGAMREVAERLKLLSDPATNVEQPDYATPDVAARALLELYRMAAEGQG